MISFDQILQTRVGTGYYQKKVLATTGLVEFCDGMLFTLMSILMTLQEQEWNLTKNEISSFGSSFLFGILAGNFLCAFVADRFGRKSTICVLFGIAGTLSIYGSFCDSYFEMLILRLLFGIVYGATYPLGYVIISEVTESKYRGRFANAISLIYILGRIYLVCLCYLFLENYKEGNWRGLLRVNIFPFVVALLFSLILVKETIRYYLNNGQYQLAYKEIEELITTNGNQDNQLTDDEKQGLLNWSEKQKQEHKEKQLHFYGVLQKDYLKVTLMLWIQYSLINFENMSIYLLMPFLFSQNNLGFTPMLYMYGGEFIWTLILHHVIDDPKHGGRSRIIAYSASILILSNSLIYIFREQFLVIGLLVVKLCIRGLLSTIGIVCCESYPLQIRAQGMGIAQGIGKIITFPSPYLLFSLYYNDPYLPFLLMLVLAILILIVDMCCLTSDRTQQPLETLKEE